MKIIDLRNLIIEREILLDEVSSRLEMLERRIYERLR